MVKYLVIAVIRFREPSIATTPPGPGAAPCRSAPTTMPTHMGHYCFAPSLGGVERGAADGPATFDLRQLGSRPGDPNTPSVRAKVRARLRSVVPILRAPLVTRSASRSMIRSPGGPTAMLRREDGGRQQEPLVVVRFGGQTALERFEGLGPALVDDRRAWDEVHLHDDTLSDSNRQVNGPGNHWAVSLRHLH